VLLEDGAEMQRQSMAFAGIFDAREGDCAPLVAQNAQGSVMIGSTPWH